MVLLDTCVLLWIVSDQRRLSAAARKLIEASPGARYVSAITAFEIGVKRSKGQLTLHMDPEQWFGEVLARYGIQALAMDWMIATKATQLPRLHGDPADRIIISTALHHHLSIVTPDPIIARYPDVTVIW